jgi:DNA-binding NtrC family response regulator
MALILVVDDEPRMAEAIATALARSGHDCRTATSGREALEAFGARRADLVITDWRMPEMDGLALMREIHKIAPSVPVILITAFGDVPSAVAAMREGAFDYVTKPFDNDELRTIAARAIDLSRLERENRSLREQSAGEIVASSPAMKRVLELVDRVARSKAAVLIHGESGTGKELIAKRLHALSDRVSGPFVAVNCKAFADSVLESELFGHEKGAFTGAQGTRLGCFERAHGGTLFLDEIGEISGDFQAKLLRVLQEGEVLRVGGSSARKVDVRIVAATNRELRKEATEGRFREDLFFRLNVIPIELPPLSSRPEDVLPLARHFLARAAKERGRQLELSAEAEARLVAHPWPGNVREIENAIERASVLAKGEQIEPEDLLLEAGSSAPRAPTEVGRGSLQEAMDAAAEQRIRTALIASGGRRAEAAAALGIDRTTLYRLMKRFDIGAE